MTPSPNSCMLVTVLTAMTRSNLREEVFTLLQFEFHHGMEDLLTGAGGRVHKPAEPCDSDSGRSSHSRLMGMQKGTATVEDNLV